MRAAAADLNNRTIVGIELLVGRPNRSIAGMLHWGTVNGEGFFRRPLH